MARIASTSSRMRAAGRGPWQGEPSLDVGLDLGAEPEAEAPVRQALEVPRLRRERHGAPGEGDRDPGRQLEALGGVGGQHEREERVMRPLEGEGAVVAGRLHGPGGRRDLGRAAVTRVRRRASSDLRGG